MANLKIKPSKKMSIFSPAIFGQLKTAANNKRANRN